MARTLEFEVGDDCDGIKLLYFLRNRAKLSSRLIKSLKRIDGGLRRNGEHIRTVDPIRCGDIISVNMPDDMPEIEQKEFDLEVLFEDEDLLIINKPAHLAMHPSHNHQGDTLANAVAYRLARQGKASVFRCVGRLDRDTSGIVICALNPYSAARLTEEVMNRQVKKTYYAVADAVLNGSGTINAPIYRPHPLHTYRCVDERGDRAVTHWQALKNNGKETLVKVNLETGRTHQIRVHFAHIGAALVGDTMYGKADGRIDRQALHCGEVCFTHPVTNEKMSFITHLPKDMAVLV